MLVGDREETVRSGLTANHTVIERRDGLTEVTTHNLCTILICIHISIFFVVWKIYFLLKSIVFQDSYQ